MALGLTAAMLPLMMLPPAQAATPPPLTPTDGPATVLVLSPVSRTRVNDWLSGAMCHAGTTCRDIKYVAVNIPGGEQALDTSIATTPDTKVVFAYSGGAAVVANWLADHAADPVDPNLSFVLIGNPTRKYGGSGLGAVSRMPETGYHVVDITREYDSVSDFPNNPFNLLADANAFAGFVFIHLDYSTVNVYDTANTVWTEGNTTYVFVPTPNLPLLEPLRRLGLVKLADQLNAPLKAMVDKAYDRSYLVAPPAPTPPPTDPPTVPPAGTDPTTLTQTTRLATITTTQAVVTTPALALTSPTKVVNAEIAPAVDGSATSTPAKPKNRSSLQFWPHRTGVKTASSTTSPTPPTSSTISTTGGNKAEPGGVTSASGTGSNSGSGSGSGSNAAEGSTPASPAGGDGPE